MNYNWEENKEDSKQIIEVKDNNSKHDSLDMSKEALDTSKIVLSKSPKNQSSSIISIEKYHGAIVYDS